MTTSLITVRGPIGVGKTSVSEAIRRKMPGDSSVVEADAIKIMLDPNGSSEWRRNLAHDAAGFLTRGLLDIPRTPIVEMHTKYQDFELQRYAQIASEYRVPIINVLLRAPLEVCLERSSSRDDDSGLLYAIDADMITNYYCKLEPKDGDLVFDTVTHDPEFIAEQSVAFIVDTI